MTPDRRAGVSVTPLVANAAPLVVASWLFYGGCQRDLILPAAAALAVIINTLRAARTSISSAPGSRSRAFWIVW